MVMTADHLEINHGLWVAGQRAALRSDKGGKVEELSCPGTPIMRTRLDGRVIYPEGGYFHPEPGAR